MAEQEEDYSEQAAAGHIGGQAQLELLRRYLDFAGRAIRARWLLSGTLAVIGLSLTIVVATFWPRTYSCLTVLMPVANTLLDGKGVPPLLVGAEEVILRRENLEGIIRDIGLVEKAEARRPPILKLKDRIMRPLVGELDPKTKVAVLWLTLDAKVNVTIEKNTLLIKASWGDPDTAAEIAEAARESFVRARHTTEMSAFEDKMAIYNQHATKLRADIAVFADQLEASYGERANQAIGEQAARKKAAESATPDKGEDAAGDTKSPKPIVAPRIVRNIVPSPSEPDAQLPEMKEQLETLKHKLTELETDRDRRLREAQTKLEDLNLRLTPSHPDVISQRERIAMLSAVPGDLAQLRSDVRNLELSIKLREGASRPRSVIGGGVASSTPGKPAEAPLPTEITTLLRRGDGDPALMAQLQSAINTYTTLREELLNQRLDLDTAQAAFNHRYQVITPAEVPNRPNKPNVTMIIVIGLLLSLIVAAATPFGLELKKGVLVDRWQVEDQLPVLAELHLPPYSGE